MKVVSFEKLKSDWDQTWLTDTIWDTLYVHSVVGDTPRLKVTGGQVARLVPNHPQITMAGNTSILGITKYFFSYKCKPRPTDNKGRNEYKENMLI